MTNNSRQIKGVNQLPLSMVLVASMSSPVSAFQFNMGDVEASLDTTLSLGASWRVEKQSPALYGQGNGGAGASINNDDGNLNFEKGDTYSKLIKGSSDFLITYQDWGAFARAKYWYDFELKDESRAEDINGYTRSLSKAGKDNASGAELLDAYIWRDFWLGNTPLNVRLGKQVVSWGESTFIFNGINVINPVDIGAIRAPGAQIKEALLPVNMLYGSLGLTDDVTLEAFVQLEYESSRLDDCGTYFSTVDNVADGCNSFYMKGTASEQENHAGLGLLPYPAELERLADQEAGDEDQFGLALRWYSEDLNDTEFGFYFIQYHSRFPSITGIVAQDFTDPTFTQGPDGVVSLAEALHPVYGAKYFIENPERIQLYGLSFNTVGPGGISLGGEYSFKHDMPVQLNYADLILGATVVGDGISPVFQSRVPDTDGNGVINTADAVASGFLGAAQKGYDLYDVSQIQMTAIKFVDQTMGASRLSFVGEVGATFIHDLPDKTEQRYGRFDQLGFGLVDGLTPASCLALGLNTVGGCHTDGYVTSFSWGYRMRTTMQYDNVFAGVNLSPQFALSHDVKGNAPGPGANFIEGRKSIGLSLKADYINKYSATLAYTNYFGAGKYNPLSDRDNVSLSASYSF